MSEAKGRIVVGVELVVVVCVAVKGGVCVLSGCEVDGVGVYLVVPRSRRQGRSNCVSAICQNKVGK